MMKLSNRPHRVAGMLAAAVCIWLAVNSIIGTADVSLAAEICSINVRDKVEIDGEEILLKKIAEIDGQNQELIQQLNDIVVGKAPLPGQSRTIGSDYLMLRLKQNGINLSELNLQCPQRIEISRSYIEVSKEEIEKIVTGFLYQNALKGNKAASIKDLCVPESVILPKGQITYQVSPPQNTTILGKVPLAVHFNVDEHFQKKVWATATIEMLTDVVVAAKPLGKHKPITEDDIELKEMDLADLPSNVITDLEAVLGKRTTNTISSQTVLRTDLIELPPLVNRGDIVVIVAESKGLRVTALGKVKKKGRVGERIPVENLDSKKTLYAQVIDSRMVKVEF